LVVGSNPTGPTTTLRNSKIAHRRFTDDGQSLNSLLSQQTARLVGVGRIGRFRKRRRPEVSPMKIDLIRRTF